MGGPRPQPCARRWRDAAVVLQCAPRPRSFPPSGFAEGHLPLRPLVVVEAERRQEAGIPLVPGLPDPGWVKVAERELQEPVWVY